MKWFRFYSEAVNDPKVQRLPGDLFKLWVNLLCLANENSERGTLPADIEDVAWRLRIDSDLLRQQLHTLQGMRLLDWSEDTECYTCHNWEARQKVSDDVTARVNTHRNKVKESETLHVTDVQRFSNALEENREEENREEAESVSPPHPGQVNMPSQTKMDIALFEKVQRSATNLLGRKLPVSHVNKLQGWFNKYKKSLTPDLIDYAESETAGHTDGKSLDYFTSVMQRVIEEPNKGKPVKGKNGASPPDPTRTEMPGPGYSWDTHPDGSWKKHAPDPVTGLWPYGYSTLEQVEERDKQEKADYLKRTRMSVVQGGRS